MKNKLLTELPQRWYIVITDENRDLLNTWRASFLLHSTKCYYDAMINRGWGTNLHNTTGLTEITTAQFRRWILKEPISIFPLIGRKFKTKGSNNIYIIDSVQDNIATIRWGVEDFMITKYPAEVLKQYIDDNIWELCQEEYKVVKIRNISSKIEFILNDKNEFESIHGKASFKVIEPQFDTYYQIVAVENREGNNFTIDDQVCKLGQTMVQTIKGFKFDKTRTNLLAVTTKLNFNGISINKIEHYTSDSINDKSESSKEQEEVKVETDLEKAKRLYPISTKFYALNTRRICTITGTVFGNLRGLLLQPHDIWELSGNNECKTTGNISHFIYDSSSNRWAEIVE